MPNKSKHREAVDVVDLGFEEVADREVAPGLASGDELLESIIP